MAQDYLPEVFDAVKGIANHDKGNVFDSSFLFPKRAEKRMELQKEIMTHMMDINERITLEKINTEKEITMEQLKYSYQLQVLKHETLRQFIDFAKECNYNSDFIASELNNIGDVISKM